MINDNVLTGWSFLNYKAVPITAAHTEFNRRTSWTNQSCSSNSPKVTVNVRSGFHAVLKQGAHNLRLVRLQRPIWGWINTRDGEFFHHICLTFMFFVFFLLLSHIPAKEINELFVPFQNGGQITDFHFASFRFRRKKKRKLGLLSHRNFWRKFGSN